MNNPPAFPVFPETSGGHAAAFQGMTLRDYFAAKALPAAIKEVEDAETYNLADVAAIAYQYADAMMEFRNAAQ